MNAPSWRMAAAIAVDALRGRLSFPRGHFPPAGHTIPAGFAGVGVAASDDPAVDDYLIERLRELDIRHVRLDFCENDHSGPPARLLDALLGSGFSVVLHLVQTATAARLMPNPEASRLWRAFVVATLDRYGKRIEAIEGGTTVNRQRWAGHTVEGFLAYWEIIHAETRSRGIVLAGPNVTDFEPIWNIGLLAVLADRKLLPDIHTDNLFSERCTEPERFDNKVFGRSMVSWGKYNLIKKARLLQRIGADYGVPRLWSPAAFWTLPRIERMLPPSEEKQADYLARYLVLCAASGALERAWWGPLICQREGLIDNGEAGYPALERITHYASVEGCLDNFRIRPAFHALRTFQAVLAGATYDGRLIEAQDLEVHGFSTLLQRIHVVWTINGKAAALADIYPAADLQTAHFLSRDGIAIDSIPTLVGESLIYICWPVERSVTVNARAVRLADLAIDWHAGGKTHVLFRDKDWQGIIRAANDKESTLLLEAIHPERIGAPPKDTLLRHARNAIWTLDDPRTPGARLVVKQPVKMHFHKRWLDRFKPSKALRSWNGTHELLRRGIAAATPIAYFERSGDKTLLQNYYICEYVAADCTVRELMSAYAGGATHHLGVPAEDAYRQLVEYLLLMHGRGIFFRDLSGGNILVRKCADGRLAFTLIDTGRIHVFLRPLPLGKRLADLVRICNKLHWPGREMFMSFYLSPLRKHFAFHYRLSFYLYDLKVWMKRHVGRKLLKRWLSR